VVVSRNATAPSVTEKVDGIPFYAKVGVCTQETVWLEPQFTWSLTIQADDQAPVTKTVRLSGYAYQQEQVQESLGTLQALNGKHEVSAEDPTYCPATIRNSWDGISMNGNYFVKPVTEDAQGLTGALPGSLVRVANTATVGSAVDYSRTYYINARTPFIGTGNLDAKLNPDGTLGEGNSQVNDQTWGTVIGALGGMSTLAQTLSGIATPAAAAPASGASASPPPALATSGSKTVVPRPVEACRSVFGWPQVKKTVTYTFAVASAVYQHDHTLQTRLGSDGVCAAAPGAGVTEGNFVVTPVAPPAPAATTDAGKPPAPDTGKKPDAPAPAPTATAAKP
jgi:hypothetical protein